MNLNMLESLRTKDEVKDYFRLQGLKITEEEIENLRKKYSSEKLNTNALTLNQLSKVAGGVLIVLKEMENNGFTETFNETMRNVAHSFAFEDKNMERKYICLLINDKKIEASLFFADKIENQEDGCYFENLIGEQQHKYKIDVIGEITNQGSKSTACEKVDSIYGVTKLNFANHTKVSQLYKSLQEAYDESVKNAPDHFSKKFEGLQDFMQTIRNASVPEKKSESATETNPQNDKSSPCKLACYIVGSLISLAAIGGASYGIYCAVNGDKDK